MHKRPLSDRIFDSKPVTLLFDWVLKPIFFTLGMYLIGIILLSIADQLFHSNWVNTIPSWERWIASVLLGIFALGIWQESKDNQYKDTF